MERCLPWARGAPRPGHVPQRGAECLRLHDGLSGGTHCAQVGQAGDALKCKLQEEPEKIQSDVNPEKIESDVNPLSCTEKAVNV